MTKFQKIAMAAALVLAILTALYQAKRVRDVRAELQKFQTQQAPLVKEIGDLQAAVANLTNQLASLQAENSRLKKDPNDTELLKLRSEVTRLRPLQNDVAELQKMLKQSSTALAQWKTNELADVGCATPIDAIQTYLYSSRPDPPKIQNSFVGDDVDPPSEEALEKFIKNKIEHRRALVDMDAVDYKILSQNWIASDKVRVELEAISPGGIGVAVPITLRKIDGEWKFVVFNVRDKHGTVSELDFVNSFSSGELP